MNNTNKESKPADNMELLKQQSEGCGSGCSCHSAGASCSPCRWIGVLVLIAAGVLVVRAMNKPDPASPAPETTGFTTPVAASTTSEVVPAASAPAPAPATSEATQPAETAVGTPIGAFAELNTAAANTDAVFVYLPGKQAGSAKAPAAAMQAAATTLKAKGTQCALFTLKAGSPDYDKLAPDVTLPVVLAMVKGKGMSPVTGEITETKLIQGYVAASSAGGCGPSGCGPSGCN